MTKLKSLLGIFTIALLAFGCQGPEGPPGRDGFDGLDGLDGADGVNILGQVVEIQGSFTPENNYSLLYTFADDGIEVFESDVVLVYLLWEEIEDPDGNISVWRPMPQTRILDQGLLLYNYDHTFLDVSLFLESDFDLGTLQAGDTQNQVFRIAVVPAEFANSEDFNPADFNSVMNALNQNVNTIEKVSVN